MSETCYIRPVDGRPTQARYTSLSNITGSIQIRMEFKPTISTPERGTLAITFVNVTTNRTFLRCETGVNRDNLLTEVLRFVPNKPLKFKERPVIQFPVKLGTTPVLDTDFGQVFESEHGVGGLYNLLRDTVINISHKPSFSAGKFTEFPFGGSSAFGLQISSEMRVFCSRILHSRRIEKRVVRTYSDIHDTPVDTKNFLFSDKIGSFAFKLTMQVKRLIISPKRESRRFDLPCQIWPVVFWNTKRSLNSTIRCGNSRIPGSQKHVDNPGIVSHSRILFTERFKLTFNRFQRFASNIPSSLHQRGRKIRYRLSNIVIGSVVAINLTSRMGFKTPRRTKVKSHSIIPHSFQERSASISRNIKFQLNCPNHIHILTSLEYTPFGGERRGAIPPVTKVTGFLASRS